jgi:predicted PurR-regulated permease PerM
MPERGSLDALFWKAILLAAVLWVLYRSPYFVVIALLSLILAAAMMPIADAMERRRVPRAVTVGAIYLLGIGTLVLCVALLVPVVVEQMHLIAAQAPAYRLKIAGWIESVRALLGGWSGAGRIAAPEIGLQDIGPVAQNLLTRSLAATRGIFTGMVGAIFSLFVAGYVVLDRPRISRGLLAFVPPARRREAARVGEVVLDRMGGYVRGQMAVSACVALVLTIGLAILRIDAPLLIGLTAGILNLVPFLGSAVALTLALLIAVNMSTFAVLGVLVVFAGAQILEGYVFSPYFLGRNVDLHPLAVLAALIVGGSVAGVVGALLAVPAAAGINALVQQIYIRPMEE